MRRVWDNGPLLLAACMACWAGSVVMGRAAAELVPPALFTAVRWGGALLIVAPLAWPHWRRDAPALRRAWWVPVVLGLLGVATYNSVMYRALHDTTAVNALLLQSATPLLILVVAFLMFGERPRWRQAVAILVSIAGVLVIAVEGSWTVLTHLRLNPGDALVMVSVLAYAVYCAVLRKRPAVHPMSLLAASIGAGMVVLLPLAWVEYVHGGRLVVTALSLASLGYAVVFPAVVAYLAFNRGVELVGAARAGQYMHLMPVFGIVLAVVFLGEGVGSYHLVGVGLIGVGLWLAEERGVVGGGVGSGG